MQRLVSVNAGATEENVFSGSAFEFSRARSIISIGVAQSATGGFVTINNGVDIVAEEFEPQISANYPTTDADFFYNFGSVQGDRIVLRYRNPTAGALVVRAIAIITFQ